MNFPPPTKHQARIIWLALTGLAAALLVSLVGALVWGLAEVVRVLSPVLWPVAVAGVISYLLDPLVDFFERKIRSRTRAISCVFALALMVVVALFGSVVPQLVNETQRLVASVPEYANRLESRVRHWASHPPEWLKGFLDSGSGTNPPPASITITNEAGLTLTTNLAIGPGTASTNQPGLLTSLIDKDNLQTATGWLGKVVPKIGSWLFGQVGRVASWFGVLAGLALVPVYAFYFLLEKRRISSHWTDYLPVADSGFKQELVFVLNSINNYLIAFFRGQVLVAICDGILYATGFLIIGLPYAVLIGAFAIFLTMIPFLGAIVTCAAALILAVVQYGDWLHPLLVLAVFAVVQALEGTVISPKIMGGRVGLHPVTIIIAVMAGTTLLGGLLGGILAIPLTAALRVIMFRYVWKRPNPESEEAGKSGGG
jgi:predicted PurR-regulated permease PerM